MKRIVLRPSFKSQLAPIIMGVSCLMFAFRGLSTDLPLLILISKLAAGFSIFFALLAIVNIYNYKYILFEDFIQATEGILSLNMVLNKIKYQDIRLVETQKSILGRIINFGDVLIGSAATGTLEVVLRGVSNPDLIKDFVLKKASQKRAQIKHNKQEVINQ